MEQFKAKTKRWGNSIGLTIPAKIINDAKIHENEEVTVLLLSDQKNVFDKAFGSRRFKHPTQSILDDIDQEEHE